MTISAVRQAGGAIGAFPRFRGAAPRGSVFAARMLRRIAAAGVAAGMGVVAAGCASLDGVEPAREGAVAAAGAAAASAQQLTFATWNLGWHISREELPPWLERCGRRYRRDASSGRWRVVAPGTTEPSEGAAGAASQAREAPTGAGVIGWQIREPRAVLDGVDLNRMPPCDVQRTADGQGVAVTAAAWDLRLSNLAQRLQREVAADVLAFQEVSGVQAVREALGSASEDYEVCASTHDSVQRVALAWRRSRLRAEAACTTLEELGAAAGTGLPPLRPGLQVVLAAGPTRIRVLTLHLKSGCVSPLDGARGRLDAALAPQEPCARLQHQIWPLERIWEHLGQDVDGFVVLGDFNRNLSHEWRQLRGAEAVRSDGSTDLQAPRAQDVRTRNLLAEVDDGDPPHSKALLVEPECAGSSQIALLCRQARERRLTRAERVRLAAPDALGCRNLLGLDHVLVSRSLVPVAPGELPAANAPGAPTAIRLALGALGQVQPGQEPGSPISLAVSDHCPLLLRLPLRQGGLVTRGLRPETV